MNWVRDQQDADVHVIMTSQNTGAGGREYILDFMGRGAYENYEEQSRYQALPTDTQRERLDGVTLTLGLGLAMFATQFGFRDVIRLDGLASAGGVDANAATAEAGLVSADQVQDPWNLWVLSVDVGGDFEGESTTREYSLDSSVSASRVTLTWKQSYRASFDYNNLEQERP